MKKYTWFILSLGITLIACSPSESDKQSDKQSTQSAIDSTEQKTRPPTPSIQDNEKSDIIQIAEANQIYTVEEMQKKEKDWAQRLENARTDADTLKVFHEQIAHFREREKALAAKQLKSEKGQAIQQQMLQNFRNIQTSLEKMTKVDFNTPNGEMVVKQFQQESQQHAQDAVKIMQTWTAFAQEHGFDIRKEHQAIYKQKMQELQAPLQ